MNFIKNVLSTVVGIFVFTIIAFMFLVIIGLLASIGSDSSKVSLQKDTVINLDLSEISSDFSGATYIEDFHFRDEPKNDFVNVLNAVERAKTDDKIRGIKMFNTQLNIGLAQAKELRKKLEEFKKTGKFVLSYSDAYTQMQYYLGSVSDTVYINPVGDFDFKGLSTEILYMKDLQEKVGIKMEVIRHGKYKSAVEPYIQQEMSEANREQNTELLNSIWHTYATDISQSRNISVDKLNNIANNLSARTPEMAKEQKLVDKIAYVDEFENSIKKALNVKYDQSYNEIDIQDYINVGKTLPAHSSKNVIAVIYAQGEITGGEGNINEIGEGAINRALIEARTDEDVKAVVLRVNSPGGSALTSDLILREVELTKKVKPVVVSMGNYAASGGYYIACKANKIFAETNTITGSIGVFGMVPNATQIAQRWGVNPQEVKTHNYSSGYSIFKPMTDKEREVILEGIERVYTTFVNNVAQGRNMTFEQVDKIAQGRVWTGTKAKEIGLVDELGGLEDAIKYAAKMVEAKDYRVASYPEYNVKFKDIFRSLLGMEVKQAHNNAIIEKIGVDNYNILQRINYLQQAKGVQAILPYHIKVE